MAELTRKAKGDFLGCEFFRRACSHEKSVRFRVIKPIHFFSNSSPYLPTNISDYNFNRKNSWTACPNEVVHC